MARPLEPSLLTPDQLAYIGRILYGDQWQIPMARDLEVNDRQVRYMLSGERPIHCGILTDLLEIAENLQADLNEVAKDLRKAIKQAE